MKIAIVGAGIVGSTAAYYLSKEKDVDVTESRGGDVEGVLYSPGVF